MADYLLDTDILFLHLRDHPDMTASPIRWSKTSVLYNISMLTRAEVLAGMRPHEESCTMELLESLTSIVVDEAVADQAGRSIYQYARQGIQISFPDALTAATALQHDLTLVTTNFKHFPVPEARLYRL